MIKVSSEVGEGSHKGAKTQSRVGFRGAEGKGGSKLIKVNQGKFGCSPHSWTIGE